MEKIIIIGNGIAGITAARHIRKNCDSEILVISSESEEFYARTSLMYVYMGHMTFKDTIPYERSFWAKNRIDLIQDHVASIDPKSKQINTSSNGTISFDKLIIASGSKSNFINWKGSDLNGVQALYFKQDLDEMETNTKNISSAAIIGGGLIGLELAEMLLSRGIEVYFVIRERKFWSTILPKEDSQFLVDNLAKKPNLHMLYDEELEEIRGDESGKVNMINTKSGKEIKVQFVAVSIGVVPNISFLEDSGLQIEKGILVDEFLETSEKDIYAIGDCAQLRNPKPGRRAVDQVWYTGRIMGETVAKTVGGTPTEYDPGNWFNSAKFFEIEYQTYGDVSAKLNKNHDEFIWKHAEKDILLHFVFEKETNKFIGINSFGIRMRHELFDNWLINGHTIDSIISNLRAANFDPEFYRSFENQIVEAFNLQFDRSVKLKKKEWWRNLLVKN